MKANIIMALFLSFLMHSCFEDPDPALGIVEGMKPLYVDPNLEDIVAIPPIDTDQLGKIVYVEPYIFINELYQGIHVIDNSDPSNPINIVFWQIFGNIDFTIDGNFLYADNSIDLYTIDISDFYNISIVSTIKNIYGVPSSEASYPVNYNGVFECVDPNLGIVVGWELTSITNPNCWR